MIQLVISGGQTGADRGGLDAAVALGIEHLALVPRGRRAEDGAVPECYRTEEHESPDYLPRTRACVERSDATIVFTRGRVTPGSTRTIEFAVAASKPVLHVNLQQDPAPAGVVRQFVERCGARVLNVAGSRESRAPGIQNHVAAVLCQAFAPVEGL